MPNWCWKKASLPLSSCCVPDVFMPLHQPDNSLSESLPICRVRECLKIATERSLFEWLFQRDTRDGSPMRTSLSRRLRRLAWFRRPSTVRALPPSRWPLQEIQNRSYVKLLPIAAQRNVRLWHERDLPTHITNVG